MYSVVSSRVVPKGLRLSKWQLVLVVIVVEVGEVVVVKNY
jgi:hypothetical protein